MKSLTKSFAMAVFTLVLASGVDSAQAGKHGGGHSKSSSSHRSSHGSSFHSKFLGSHGSSHHNKHHGGGHHHKNHIIHNYLHNNLYKNIVRYYHDGRTHYDNPYCPVPVIEVERTPVPDGSTLSIPGKWFRSRGHAWMMIADRRFPIRILESTPGALTMQLPHMGVSEPTPARFFLVLPDGLIVEKNYILLTPQALIPAPVPMHP